MLNSLVPPLLLSFLLLIFFLFSCLRSELIALIAPTCCWLNLTCRGARALMHTLLCREDILNLSLLHTNPAETELHSIWQFREKNIRIYSEREKLAKQKIWFQKNVSLKSTITSILSWPLFFNVSFQTPTQLCILLIRLSPLGRGCWVQLLWDF